MASGAWYATGMELFGTEVTWVLVLYALLFVDSLGAFLIAWFGNQWYSRHLGVAAHWFPPAKGWAVMYIILTTLLLLTYLRLI